MLGSIVILIIGLIGLIIFSDVFVDAASSLALRLKVPKLLVALTIAAFGTCAPELAISFNSISIGNADITLANVIGSSIVNILLIIGMSAIVKPIKLKDRVIKKELPLLMIITTAFFFLISDNLFKSSAINGLSRADGFMLICWFIIFILYILRIVRKNNKEETEPAKYSLKKSIVLIIISLILIIIASDAVVENAVFIATKMGISQKIITMTIIVIGTSLPELIMTVTSARKSEFDMAVGNIIGTNIFNMCIVLGLPVAIYGGISSNSFNLIDNLIVLFSSILFFIFGRSDKELSRLEGILMILIFIVYYFYILIT